MKDFIYTDSWFDKKYAALGHRRHPTMKAALNIALQNPYGSGNILETGCARLADDWGAGLSTMIFGDFCKHYNKQLITVDLSAANMETAKKLTAEYSSHITYIVGDSVAFIDDFDDDISLFYADSYDFEYGELLDIYGGREDLNKAIGILAGMSDQEILDKHPEVIRDSQQHCLNEIIAAIPHITQDGCILIDDIGAPLPARGKGRLATEYLLDTGWTCLLEMYQSLWVKND